MNRNDAIKEKSVIKTEITAVINEGSGVSRYKGAVVFTPFTAPGDSAEVKIEKVGKPYYMADNIYTYKLGLGH